MIEKVVGLNKAIIVNTLAVILAASTAIIIHAVMPAGVNAENFDSVLHMDNIIWHGAGMLLCGFKSGISQRTEQIINVLQTCSADYRNKLDSI